MFYFTLFPQLCFVVCCLSPSFAGISDPAAWGLWKPTRSTALEGERAKLGNPTRRATSGELLHKGRQEKNQTYDKQPVLLLKWDFPKRSEKPQHDHTVHHHPPFASAALLRGCSAGVCRTRPCRRQLRRSPRPDVSGRPFRTIKAL